MKQVMGPEWMNTQEDYKRCKAEDGEKQGQQGSSPEVLNQHRATATASA